MTTALTSNAAVRTFYLRVNRRASGGSGLGRMFDKATNEVILYNISETAYAFERLWSTVQGTWTFARPALNTWASIIIEYDQGSTTNDPVVYVDGTSVTVTESATPSGTVTTTTGAFHLGNRAAGARVWDGMLAEFAVWDRALAAEERAGVAAGSNPKAFPASLVEYVPMLETDDPVVSCVLADPTVTGTATQAHPLASAGCGGIASRIQGPVALLLTAG